MAPKTGANKQLHIKKRGTYSFLRNFTLYSVSNNIFMWRHLPKIKGKTFHTIKTKDDTHFAATNLAPKTKVLQRVKL